MNALGDVVKALDPLPHSERVRVLSTACVLLKIDNNEFSEWLG